MTPQASARADTAKRQAVRAGAFLVSILLASLALNPNVMKLFNNSKGEEKNEAHPLDEYKRSLLKIVRNYGK